MTHPPAPARRTRGLQVLGGLLAVAIVVVLVAISCRPGPGPAAAPDPAATGPVLRLVGSTTVGADLAPDLAEGFLTARGATDVRRESAGGVVTVTGTPAGAAEPLRIEIRAQGTETGFTALREGTAEIAMASRRITDAEVAELAGRGALTSRASEHVLALDAVAVITHPGAGVAALDLAQLREVFTCRITDWAQLGGAPGPIRLLTRDTNSGTFESFRDSVLGGEPLCASAEPFADNQALSAAVAADRSAIGFVASRYVGANRALELHDGDTPRVGPTATAITTETYLLTRRLYLYLPTLPVDDPLAREFIEAYALSDAGQAVVQADEFVSPYATAEPVAQPCTADLPEYCAATGGAERVPFDVRFDTGTDQVDNRAARNLDLLADSLTAPGATGHQVLLVGFADNAGTDEANLVLSRQRAAAVQAHLAARGVTATLPAGFGETSPVATNDTPEGREQNRRVEVWLR